MTTSLPPPRPSGQPTRLPLLPNVSEDFLAIQRSVGSLKNPPSPGSIAGIKQDDLAHQLFNALAQVKIFTSQVAMHLDTEWRHKLFRQLELLARHCRMGTRGRAHTARVVRHFPKSDP